MAYGEIKVDTVTFTDGGIDKSVSISGLVQNPTFSGNITVTGTISGNTVQGQTVSGVTVTGTTANFVSGVFTTQISGATITGNVGSFTTITGGTVTLTSGVFASGTAAAPSVSIGTTDNGLYSPGADQVAVATSGTGRLFVDASGNVGVGTSSVNALLEVNNSTAGGEVQRIEGNYDGSGSVTLTNWRRAGGSVAAALKYNDDSSPLCMSIGTTTSHEFRIRTADTDAITIDTSQRVGIGTSAPGAKIHSLQASTGEGLRVDGADSGFSLVVEGEGSVGIGTTTPGRTLDVVGSIRSGGSTNPYLALADGTTEAYFEIASSVTRISSGTSQPLAFRIGSSEAARIDSSGRLLVGTSTQQGDHYLQVQGSATASSYPGSIFLRRGLANASIGDGNQLGVIDFGNQDGGKGATISAEGDAAWGTNDYPGRLVFSTTADGASSPTERLRITSAGLVGIGTSSPSYKLDVSGAAASAIIGAQVVNTDSSGYSNLILRNSGGTAKEYQLVVGGSTSASANNFWLYDATAGQVRLLVSSSGNVGIGTTSPGTTLDVTGITRTSTYFSANDNGYIRGDTAGELRIQAGTNGTIFRNSSNSAEYARIDSSGRLLVGTSSARGNFFGTTGQEWRFQIEGVGYLNASQALIANSGDALGSYLNFAKTRGSSVGSNTIVQSGDGLGVIDFHGADGTDFVHGARITAEVDGTPGNNDLPTRLTFATTADGASSPTERMRITSSGRVGIGTTSPTATLDCNGSIRAISGAPVIPSSGTGLEIYYASGTFTGSPSAYLLSYDRTGSAYRPINTDASEQVFRTSGSERVRLDTSGRLLVGTSTAFDTANTGTSWLVGIEKPSGYSALSLKTNEASANGAYLNLGKSRGASANSKTIVNNNDEIGGVYFEGADGSAMRVGANISAYVDGTPGASDLPTRLVFATTADGASSPTERLRIDSSGRVGIGKTSLNSTFEIYHATEPYIYLQNSTSGAGASDGLSITLFGSDAYFNNRENGAMLFYNNGSERARIDSSGRLLVGTSTDSGPTALGEDCCWRTKCCSIWQVHQ
jgi:hypothetical protein